MKVFVHESGGEGVAGTDGIGNSDLEAAMLIHLVTTHQETAIAASGDANNLDIKLLHVPLSGGTHVFVR